MGRPRADLTHVALAEELDLLLATFDHRLAAAPGSRCRFLLPPAREELETDFGRT